MTEITYISLENEMDLVLAHKRTMKLGERLGLTIATQTAFATAVSEVSRTVIDHTNMGSLQLGIGGSHPRFTISAKVSFEAVDGLNRDEEGFFFAQKLVPEFSFEKSGQACLIEMSMGVSRSLKIDRSKILAIKAYFNAEAPINAYEEIKIKNNTLSKVTSEQQQEILNEKLINEKKNEFISIASHEIKTPIAILKAYTQMLVKTSAGIDPKIGKIADKLDQQTTKLTALVQQLMDVSQIENGSMSYAMEKLSFNGFLQDVFDFLVQAHGNHQISLELSQDSQVNIDKLRMEQVLANLLGNAAKYSAKGGSIMIRSSLVEKEIIVSVQDSGIGMSEEVLGSIFEKFYRDKQVLATHAGLGMGLYIASKIVVEHGGKIWVESTPGQGSVFHFSIPCC